MPISPDSIEKAVVAAIAAAYPAGPATITRSTRLLDSHMDSLTLVSVLSEIEAVYGVAFDTDDLAEILRARDVGDLIDAVTRKLDSIS